MKGSYINDAMITQPLITKLLLTEKPDSASKYWSPGRPEDVPLQRPRDDLERSYLTVPGISWFDIPGTSQSYVSGTFWNYVQGTS